MKFICKTKRIHKVFVYFFLFVLWEEKREENMIYETCFWYKKGTKMKSIENNFISLQI